MLPQAYACTMGHVRQRSLCSLPGGGGATKLKTTADLSGSQCDGGHSGPAVQSTAQRVLLLSTLGPGVWRRGRGVGLCACILSFVFQCFLFECIY